MTDHEVSRDEARALIAQVFARHPMSFLTQEETEHGIAVRFIVTNQRLGGLHCFYLVEPVATELLRIYAQHPGAAYTMLASILMRLPLGLHIGMDNVCDTAQYETIRAEKPVQALLTNGGQPIKIKEMATLQSDTLKKMDERNRRLVPALTSGRDKQVSVGIITGAIGILLATGTTKAAMSPRAVADLIGCTDRAIYYALKKGNVTLGRLVEMYDGVND